MIARTIRPILKRTKPIKSGATDRHSIGNVIFSDSSMNTYMYMGVGGGIIGGVIGPFVLPEQNEVPSIVHTIGGTSIGAMTALSIPFIIPGIVIYGILYAPAFLINKISNT